MSDVIKTPQDGSANLVQIDQLINEAAAFIGGSDDPRARKQVEDWLDRAARRMDMSGIYLFNLMSNTYSFSASTSDSSNFQDGDTFLYAPSDFGWPADPFIMKDSDGTVLNTIEWIPWHVFQQTNSTTLSDAIPQVASIKNEFDDTTNLLPKIYLFPVLSSRVNSIEMSYWRRITKPSNARNSSTLYLPDETLECLLTGAEYFAMRHRYKESARVWTPFQQEFNRAITQAKAASHRRQQSFHGWMVPEEVGRLPVYNREVGQRTTFIALP